LQASRTMVHADESSNGQEVTLHPGDTLNIQLGENASTGYRWSVTEESKRSWNQTIRERDETVDAPAGPPGQPGVRHLFFDAVEAGTAQIEIDYARPWEKGKPPARTFRLRVQVQAAATGA
jgi:inhibitor of cysteine peptidase